ncbi:hypothetical protein EON65_47065 [archaeon]|nr:MAG: hypothetical protein EON65_47065 [archaeon]
MLFFAFSGLAVGYNYTYSWSNPKGLPTNLPWQSVSCDVAGNNCVISQYRGTASNWAASKNFYSVDGGKSWKESTLQNVSFTQILSSQNGQYVLASGGYFSSDFGASFGPISLPAGDSSLAINAEATIVYLVDDTPAHNVYKGQGSPGQWTWAILESMPASLSESWRTISCDATGQYVMTAATVGYIYTSSNYGHTFTLVNTLQEKNYNLIRSTMSADGKVRYVMVYYPTTGGIFPMVSKDYGATWSYTGFAAGSYDTNFATNADGSMLVVSRDVGNALAVSYNYGEDYHYVMNTDGDDDDSDDSTSGDNYKYDEGFIMPWLSGDGSKLVAVPGTQNSYYGTWYVALGVGSE